MPRSALSRALLLGLVALLPLPLLGGEADDGKDKEPDLPLEGKTTDRLEFTTSEGSWMSVDVSPDGRTLLFDLLGDLYLLPMAGGDARRITSGLGYDAQPVFSPDGSRIAFISDRDGSNNLWLANADGSEPRKLSSEQYAQMISPAWTPDGRFVLVTKDGRSPELVLFDVDGGSGVTLSGADEKTRVEGVGAEPSPDGRFVYYAGATGDDWRRGGFPVTQIMRLDLTTGSVDQITQGNGGGTRPLLSPDGRYLVYGTRHEMVESGLRIRDLTTGADRWLTLPVQRDSQENYRPSSRGLLPGHAFTPDGRHVVFNAGGGFHRVDVRTGEREAIPFSAEVALDIGPDLTAPYRVETGPVQATIVHDPSFAPDGETLVASVLTRLYALAVDGDGTPDRLTEDGVWAFKPVHSPDGRWLAYVTWTADDGGHIWRLRANGRGRPERLTAFAAYYTSLAWSPDSETLVALRGNAFQRHQTFSEFGGLAIDLELVSLPAEGGDQTVIIAADGAVDAHFGPEPDRVYLHDPDGDRGLFSVKLDGTDLRTHLVVQGPKGNRNGEEPPKAERVRISPDGRHALALVNKQVWVMPVTATGGKAPTVNVKGPSLATVRLTDIGADHFGWTPQGDPYWSIGSTVYRRPLDSIAFREDKDEDEQTDDDGTPADAAADSGETAAAEDEPFVPRDAHEAVVALPFVVSVERDVPEGVLVLRGANVITMAGDDTDAMARVLEDTDILIEGNRIRALGRDLDTPAGAHEIDLAGRWVLPGFIDTHAHWEFRTQEVLEPSNWSLAANLAYGVTAGLDVQTSHDDYFAYRDFVDAGMTVGQRAFMTGPGIFGNNDFESYDAVESYLRRYSDHYRTHNIKAYVAGNRKQRQWVVMAAQKLGLMPTTEGAGDQKLNLTHAIDGMHGNEHTLPDSPLYQDVVTLFAETRTAYTPTLIVQYNALSAREYFFAREDVHENTKLQRFYPHNRLDVLTQRRPVWARDEVFQFREAAAQAAKIQRAGGLVGVGGHAELQGLGYHWEMWAYGMGGMTPAEVLRAATIDGARIVGVEADLGSVEPGKLADLVVLDADPLADLRNTTAIHRVIQNGRVYDDDSLEQLWPEQRPLPAFWWWSGDDPRYVPPR